MKYKIKFKNNGTCVEKEFDLPDFTETQTMQELLDFLVIEAKANKKIAEKIGVNPGEIRKNMEYRGLAAIQANIDKAYYILHRLDESVTMEQVLSLDPMVIAEIINLVFPRRGEGNPEKK